MNGLRSFIFQFHFQPKLILLEVIESQGNGENYLSFSRVKRAPPLSEVNFHFISSNSHFYAAKYVLMFCHSPKHHKSFTTISVLEQVLSDCLQTKSRGCLQLPSARPAWHDLLWEDRSLTGHGWAWRRALFTQVLRTECLQVQVA